MKKSVCIVSFSFILLIIFRTTQGEPTKPYGIYEGSSFYSFFGLSYIFNFKGDSVFITEKFCNDVPDNCHNSRCYNTFFTCTFQTIHDSLLIKGHCADSLFKVNTTNAGCRFGPTEVCEYSLSKRFRLSKDTVFLHVCDEDCAEKLIKKTSGVLISQKGNTTALHSSEINFHVDNSRLSITLPRNQPVYDLKILSPQGNVLYRESFISGNKPLGIFTPGVYLVSAKGSDGRTMVRKVNISY